MAFQSEAAKQSAQEQMDAVAVTENVQPLDPNKGPVVWKNFQKEGGPIVRLQQQGLTFFEFLTNREYDDLRRDSFDEWCFPDIVWTEEGRPMIVPVKNVQSTGHVQTGPRSATIGKHTVTQYGYVVLNLMKAPARSFGQYPGTEFSTTNSLVCVEVGDPRHGRLDQAYIKYALPMSMPLSQCLVFLQSLSYRTTDSDAPQGFQRLYTVAGDSVLENQIYERWWQSGDYYFNGVIYPKIKGYSDIVANRG